MSQTQRTDQRSQIAARERTIAQLAEPGLIVTTKKIAARVRGCSYCLRQRV